jgi:hypothetical protein
VARHRLLELVHLVAGEGTADELEAVRVDRHRKGDRVVGVGLAHRPLRDDHELVRDDGARRVRLRPPDDDAVLGAIDHAEVEIRVVLIRGSPAAVALYIRDGGGGHHLLALEALHVVEHARVVVGSPLGVQMV